MTKNKIILGLLTMIAIATISTFAIHSIHKTHKIVLNKNDDDIQWDI